MTKVHYCAQCKHGEVQLLADAEVRGFVYGYDSGRKVPYHAFLCDDHLGMMTDDGAELKVVDWVNDARDQHADELIGKYTGYDGVRDFLANTPTIRPGTFPGAEWLARWYREKTSRKCFA